MKRLLATLTIAALASGCLPTRERVPFEEGGGSEDMTATDTSGEDDTGVDPDADGGSDPDGGPDPDMEQPDMPPPDGCTPQTVQELCAANQAVCGMLGVTDNCGTSRTIDCGACGGEGVGCVQNFCVETNCRDETDNDQSGAGDCDDPNCRGEQCSPSPNKVCQADGSCE